MERVRVPEKPSLADEYEERLPIINWKYEVCRDTELAISVGDATPDQILAALERPDDDLIATYTKHYEDCLELCCHNHGIDPGTGKPDGRAAQLLLDAIADGASDQEALRYAYLAAHSKIPDQMMRDKQFQRRLAVARRTARKRKGSR